jgi:hypothetical protein
MAGLVIFSAFCSALIGLGFWDKSRHHKEAEERAKRQKLAQQNTGEQQLQRRHDDVKEAMHA